MANADMLSRDSFLSQVEEVRNKLGAKFAKSHQVLLEREAAMLSELDQLEFRYRGEGLNQQIEELDRLKELQLSLAKENENTDTVKSSVAVLEVRAREIRDKLEMERTSMKRVILKWDEDLIDSLSEIGTIEVSDIPVFQGDPFMVACQHRSKKSTSPGCFCRPNSMAIDSQTGNVYICDSANHRIQVFTKNLTFLFDLVEKMNFPFGISVSHNKVYVTQHWGCSLDVYNTEWEFISSVGRYGKGKLEFEWPRGVAVSHHRERIYICDSGNVRIQCLNLDFSFNCFISDIPFPRDVKLTCDEVILLTSGNLCILFYNYSHELMRQIIPCGEGSPVIDPRYFCLDKADNILMTDRTNNCVFIFSNSGKLIYKFGQKGVGRGDFIEVRGITLDSEDRILVASKNPNYCIQSFTPNIN